MKPIYNLIISKAFTTVKENMAEQRALNLLKKRKKLTWGSLSDYSVDDMKSEKNLHWLITDVAWRVTVAGKVDYDDDYLRLAYDTWVESGVLIPSVRIASDSVCSTAEKAQQLPQCP